MAVLLCTGCTDRYMLLQYLHFHHPWWSYTARSHGWRCCYVQDVRTDICSSATARLGLLSRSTTYIHVSVLRCSNMLHPCNDAISALPPSMVVVYRKEPWMAVLLCTGCTDRYMLLQYLHFHHPWWSYTARSHEWRCCYVRDAAWSQEWLYVIL